MGGISSWLDGNWFNLIQTVGIMGSLWLAAAAAIREAKAREIENLLTIAQNHRELWSGVYQRRELDRIFQMDADVKTIPVTVAEKEFLNLVMVHYQMGWRIAKAGGITTLTELAADVRGFFALPLPRSVWEKTKANRNPRFVLFVEQTLRN
jgi:hypothetical protein